ncbi:hypothetical protein MUP79_03350 [Candidatus Bathyarchaeota archaeon]|nr:hypothetical protein [Candidatus Bathyarchaeota archaeon]
MFIPLFMMWAFILGLMLYKLWVMPKKIKELRIAMHQSMLLEEQPHMEIEWLYTFLDITPSSAFVYQMFDDKFSHVNCIVVMSLTQRASEQNLVHSMNHEAIHCAIKTAMKNGAIGEEHVVKRMLELSEGAASTTPHQDARLVSGDSQRKS